MNKKILMLGTSFETPGGISSVVKVYRDTGLLSRQDVRYLETHRDGSAARKLNYFLRAWLRFAWLSMSCQIALMHVHHASHASFWRKLMFILPAYLLRVPVVIHLHGGGFAKFYAEESGPRVQALIRLVYDRAACVIVVSQTWRKWVQSISRNPNVQAVYNPVQVPPMVEFATREEAMILFLGKIGPIKGCYDLLRAVARLQHKYPRLKICMAGNGELAQARALGDELGLRTRLELPGWIDGAQKQQFLARASIYAQPSYFEALPMSILEAMACGLPVLATLVGGIPDVVADGEHGLLVPPRDVDALTAALDRLLADATLRRRMGAYARNQVEHIFSSDRILPQIDRIYSGILSGGTCRGSC
jgi:glycosyltransferase involved in cell wall biosynthesis